MRKSARGRVVGAFCLSLVAVVVAACGSSASNSSNSNATVSSTSSSAAESTGASESRTYSGIDSTLPARFPKPVKKSATFKVGFLQIEHSIPVLAAEQSGAEAEAKKLGLELIVKDANLDIEKQTAEFEQLLAQGVKAIAVYPVVPKTLAPQLAKAKAAGIPVISTDARPDISQPLPKGYTADVEQSLDYEAFELTKAVSEAKPGASFAVMGLGAPVEALQYLARRQRYWGEKFGLKYEGEIDAKQDNPAGYSAAATAILAKDPNVGAILTYVDAAALSTSSVVRSSGRTGILITGAQGGEAATIEAIKAGSIFATYSPPWAETGAEMIRGAYSEVTNQNLPLPETVTLKGTLVTKANASEFTPVEGG